MRTSLSQRYRSTGEKLPPLSAGAPAWILTFEDNTEGEILAIGNICALLFQTEGVPSAQRLLKGIGIGSGTHDSDCLDPFQ